MYVGLLSDTHGVFSDSFRKFFDPVDVLWHAGDFGGDYGFLESMREFKPIVGVYGNCDGMDLRRDCPEYRKLEVQGLSVLMTHIGGSPGHYYPRAKALIEECRPDVFICGHSHILKVMRDPQYGFMYLNPGAAGIQGWQVFRTALRFRIEDGQMKDMEVFKQQRNAI